MPQGTIKGAANFNPERQAEALRKAMKGIGTDEKMIIQVMAAHNNQQRVAIRDKFKQMYGKDLETELKSEISGHFEAAVLALLMPRIKFDAVSLRRAMKGAGTDESALIEILLARSNSDIAAIKQAYKTEFGRDLEADLESETSGHFKRLLVSASTGSRQEGGAGDAALVRKDAEDLYAAGEGKIGTDESTFNRVLSLRSFAHLRAVFAEYQKLSGHDIASVISSETSGTLKEGLLSIVKYVNDPASYYAERLYRTMKGAGTDDDTLVRLLVAHSEIDLDDIRVAFQKKYGKTLQSFIEDDCSGDYKRILLAIVNGTSLPF